MEWMQDAPKRRYHEVNIGSCKCKAKSIFIYSFGNRSPQGMFLYSFLLFQILHKNILDYQVFYVQSKCLPCFTLVLALEEGTTP
jgi:hypothetical protein